MIDSISTPDRIHGCNQLAPEPSEVLANRVGSTCSLTMRLAEERAWALQVYFGHKPFGFHCISGIIHGLDES